MRAYLNSEDRNFNEQLNSYINRYEHRFVEAPSDRKLIKHHGHIYQKVAVLIHYEKGYKGVIMRIGAILATLCTLGALYVFSEDISEAFWGKRRVNLYVERNDRNAINAISNIIRGPDLAEALRRVQETERRLARMERARRAEEEEISPSHKAYLSNLGDFFKKYLTELFDNKNLVILLNNDKTSENTQVDEAVRKAILENSEALTKFIDPLPSDLQAQDREKAKNLLGQLTSEEIKNLIQKLLAGDAEFPGIDPIVVQELKIEISDATHKALFNGREELTTFIAIGPLSNYTQLKELENEINCPIEARQIALNDAKKLLEQLEPHEKEILIKMLLIAGDFDIKNQRLPEDRAKLIQDLYKKIGDLSKQFYLGSLKDSFNEIYKKVQEEVAKLEAKNV